MAFCPKILVLAGDSGYIDRRIVAEVNTLAASGLEVTLVSVPAVLSGMRLDHRVRVIMQPVGEVGRQQVLKRLLSKLPLRLGEWARMAWHAFGAGSVSTLVRYFMHLTPREAFAVIHCHDLHTLPAAVQIQQQIAPGAQLIYDAHELYSEQPRLTARERQAFQKLETQYIPLADRVITVNPFLAQEIERRYHGVSVAVIQNAVSPPPGFDPRRRYDLWRQEYGFSNEQILLLYQGLMAAERNLEVIISGMRLVADSRFILLMMGYGDYVQRLRLLARDQAVADRVLFVPSQPQERLLYYTASADIGLIPYPYGRDLNTHYVSPNKLYEFIMAGVPILTNNLPYVRQVVEGHGFGVWADLQTAAGFAQALADFPLGRLEEYRANVLTRQQQFHWDAEAPKLLALYRSLSWPAASLL
jgi:glycosyltransferase involved in cell wall biosynthesis